ncbi:MAG: hypothetical protein ACI4EK_04800 [Wujia sp.]
MRKTMMNLLCLVFLCACLTACGDKPSKVDEVVASQMEQQAVGTDITTTELLTEEQTTTQETVTNAQEESAQTPGVDVDLTVLSSTMVYSEVYNMMVQPQDYLGKTVKMNGAFAVMQDEDTGKMYFACIIRDATACCSQGIEFVLEGEHSFPGDYPAVGSDITVTGEFETYMEGEYTYCNLKNASFD